MKTIIKALNWRYATKKYDTKKKISATQIKTLLEAVRLSPSSFGLMPYRIIHVIDSGIRTKLREAAYGQSPLTEASHILVFAVPTNLNKSSVDDFIKLVSEVRKVPIDTLKSYSDSIAGSIASRTSIENTAWAARQAYLALGVLLTTAAIEGIDATPMEGFEPAKFDEILGLKENGLTSVVIAALGKRAKDDAYTKLPKVRMSKEQLFLEL